MKPYIYQIVLTRLKFKVDSIDVNSDSGLVTVIFFHKAVRLTAISLSILRHTTKAFVLGSCKNFKRAIHLKPG